MTTERDELAKVLHSIRDLTLECCEDCNRAIAEEILAAGYRKPSTITTIEELQALPDMTVVRTSAGTIANLVRGDAYFFGYEKTAKATVLSLPVTVLHRHSPVNPQPAPCKSADCSDDCAPCNGTDSTKWCSDCLGSASRDAGEEGS